MRPHEHLSQYEIERDIAQSLSHGDISAIAHHLGKSPQFVSSCLDPNDDRESPFFRALDWLHAMHRVNPAAARAVFDRMARGYHEITGATLPQIVADLEQAIDGFPALMTAAVDELKKRREAQR